MGPMYIIGAKKTEHNKIRFVFVVPNGPVTDSLQGDGALLEVQDHKNLMAGEVPLRDTLLEAYFETLIEGDEKTPGRGPIPCGFGISGDQLQIVGWENAEPIISCTGTYFQYMSGIDTKGAETNDK